MGSIANDINGFHRQRIVVVGLGMVAVSFMYDSAGQYRLYEALFLLTFSPRLPEKN